MPIYRNPFLDHFFVLVTWAGSLYVLLPLAGIVLAILMQRGRTEAAWLFGAGFGGAVLIVHALKRIIARPRPDLLPALVPMPIDLSFPSAHTAQITAFCLCLVLIAYQEQHSVLCWAASLMGLLVVAAVGCSRVYLRVHYISDVVAGVVIPMVWVIGFKFLLARLNH